MMTTDEKDTIKVESDEDIEENNKAGHSADPDVCDGNAEANAEAAGESSEESSSEGAEDQTSGEGDSIASEPEPEDDSEASAEDEAWSAKYTRLMADFQNFKKRTEKEKADMYAFANEKLVTELLQVLDNFERALGNECADQAYADGMEMIFKQFRDILTKSGLEEIDAKGNDFDPNFHHAVLQDDNDDFKSGQVTEVLQKGYTLNKKVIRPAMVKVNK